MAVTSLHRVHAWNVRIYDSHNKLITGAYQSRVQPFLSWKDFFEDLLLCFNLDSISTCGQLALWIQSQEGILANDVAIPWVYYNGPQQSNILHNFIKITSSPPPDSDDDELSAQLRLNLIAHDYEACTVSVSEMALGPHLNKGTINHIILTNKTNL